MTLSYLPPTVAVMPLVVWMLILTIKHVVADFILQNSWMAMGKDAKRGWALPLLAHCAIHGALATTVFTLLVPRFWYLGLVDFLIHLTIDRAKGFCVAHFDIKQNQSQWFWWLIGIDQALHHLTDFGLALVVASAP
jgi:Protein of unknown function (DUF3307)